MLKRRKGSARLVQRQGLEAQERDWWPQQLRLDLLHQHSDKSDPMGPNFNYAEAFKSLDLEAVKRT